MTDLLLHIQSSNLAKLRVFLATCSLLLGCTTLSASIDTCYLALAFPLMADNVELLDTLWVDTCNANADSYEYGVFNIEDPAVFPFLYRKTGFHVTLPDSAIITTAMPHDSLAYYEISDIDSSASMLIALLTYADSTFANLKLRKLFPHLPIDHTFDLIFSDPVSIEGVDSFLDTTTILSYEYNPGYKHYLFVPTDPGFRPLNLTSAFEPANAENRDRTFHQMGFQWQMFAQKLPMAWEITRGRESIVIAIDDKWNGNPTVPSTFPDWNPKQSSTDDGNYIPNGAPSQDHTSIGSRTSGWFGGPSHGLATAAMAVAAVDNQGMVGTCPGCAAISLTTGQLADFDVDQINDGILSRAAIANASYYGGSPPVESAIEAGVIYVSAAANSPRGSGNPPCAPCPKSPPSNVYTPGNNDPSKDYEVITVHATMGVFP